MRNFRVYFKIASAYLISGLTSLGLSTFVLYLRDGYVNQDYLSPFSTVFLWPITSFLSTFKLFRPDEVNIWLLFNFTSVFSFIFLVIYFSKTKS
jgi:hypothetical protein